MFYVYLTETTINLISGERGTSLFQIQIIFNGVIIFLAIAIKTPSCSLNHKDIN